MTTITGSAQGSTDIFNTDQLAAFNTATLSANSATQFTISDSDFSITMFGTGLTYSGGKPSGGTITSLTEIDSGHSSAQTWTGFSISVSALWQAISSGDSTTFNNLFFSGNDTFTAGGNGNNTFDGYGGDDTIDLRLTTTSSFALGGDGNDTILLGPMIGGGKIDGGDGFDTVVLDGNYGNVGLVNFVNVETVTLVNGHFYTFMGSTNTITVDGSALDATHTVTVDDTRQSAGVLTEIGGAGNDHLAGGSGNDSFDGGGGVNTVDYSRFNSSITVDLNLTTAQNVGGGAGTDTLVNIQNIVGTNANDHLTGNGADNQFEVHGGQDVIDGGAGSDTVTFHFFATGLTFDLRPGGSAGGSTLTSVENITGTQHDDTFIGNADNNNFTGGGAESGGFDTIDYSSATGGMTIAEAGKVTVMTATGAGEGTDTFADMTRIVGSGFDDTISFVHTPSIYIDGGAGNDTVSFGNAKGGVVIHLGGGSGQTSTFVSVENLTGTKFNDELSGNQGANTIHGGAGDDQIYGGSYATDNDGADTLYGDDGNDVIYGSGNATHGDGNDTIFGGAGDDQLYGGGGSSTNDGSDTLIGGPGNDFLGADSTDIVSYQDATGGVTVVLVANASPTENVGGGEGMDTFSTGVENLLGGDFDDTFTGNGQDNSLNGGAGNDTLDITAGGNDTAIGGTGNDTIVAAHALTSNDTIDGGIGNDTLTLSGNYAAKLILGATTIVGVETITLADSPGYTIVTNDATVAAGAKLTVNGSALTATGVLNFDGSLEQDGTFSVTGGLGADTLVGGKGNDVMLGGGGNDTFNGATGSDTLKGEDGDDTFNLGATLNATDVINGGPGNDTVTISGDYTAGVTFNATTLLGVDTLKLGGQHSYVLVSDDGNIASGNTLAVNASALTATDVANFDGSHELDGRFNFTDGAGNDIFAGGGGKDTFNLYHGGDDTAFGNGADDTFLFRDAMTSADRIDGGAGNDTLTLQGDYAGLTFGVTELTSIEAITLVAHHSYNLTTVDGNVAAGATLTVTAAKHVTADSLVFDGSAETDGKFVLTGGDGNDTLTGGAGDDVIYGRAGKDHLTGGAGSDHFLYVLASQSTGVNFDTITGFDAAADKFDLPYNLSHLNTPVTTGTLSAANFDTDLAAAIGHAQLGSHHAMLFTASAGDFAGDTFLVIDINKAAGYQAGVDLVIQLDNPTNMGSFGAGDFI